MRLRPLQQRLQLVERPRGRVALALGGQQRVRLKDENDAPGRHHRQRAHRGDERRHPGRELITGRQVTRVYPVDIEGAQPLLDELLELVGQARLLDVVLALQEVDRIGGAGLDLLADG